GFSLFYVLVIVRLARRELVWINVTAYPTAEWIAQQVTEAFPWNEVPRYLIRDRDAIYGVAVTRRLRAMGIRDKPISPRSPWQNGFTERLIGSIRRECVDHIVVLGEAHLRRTLQSYRADAHELLGRGWWRMQSPSNQSPRLKFPITGKITGNFARSGPTEPSPLPFRQLFQWVTAKFPMRWKW